jgi:hypothetical protein
VPGVMNTPAMVCAEQGDPSMLPSMRWSTFMAPVVAFAVDQPQHTPPG